MGSDGQFWNRDELYEEVWSTPMWTLAKKYGISDVGLAKVCRKLTIPLPGRGYWAREQAGQEVARSPLPPAKDIVRVHKPAPPKEEPAVDELCTDDERAQLARLEASNGVLLRSSSSHSLIQQARGILAKASADDRGILWTREQCLDIRVSKTSLDRAMRIVASLIATVEAEGFTVSVGNGHREHTVAKIYGQEIKFGLMEKVDRISQVAAPTGSLVDRVLTYGGKPVSYEPAGKLSIEVWNVWGPHTKRWKDGKSLQLEQLVPKALAGFIRIAIAERAEKERRAAEERERQRRIEERERRQAEIKAEQLKVRALRRLAANWERAERLRLFIAAAQETAVHHRQATEPGTPFGEWLVWATQQADRLDPLKESPASIIDLKSEEEPPSWYGYRKPDPLFRFPKPLWRMQ